MESSVPRGIATCFRGFSTFAAKPLINLSDFYVETSQRGKGIGRKLLAAIEDEAKKIGCCKLTLEVQENNATALGLGFRASCDYGKLRLWQGDTFRAFFTNPAHNDWLVKFSVADGQIASLHVQEAPGAPAWYDDREDLGVFVRQ